MYDRIRDAMERYHMAEQGEHILAAVSGGADSVCLLCVLSRLRETMGFVLEAAHVHHGLRGEEADRDQARTEELCRLLDVPLTVVRKDVRAYAKEHRMSLEESGRVLRYQALEQIAAERGCGKIALAHHMDDQAETILYHLTRGTGLRGLSGMQPVRGRLIRPMLEIRHREILDWLEARQIGWCEDSTNQNSDYARNCLRNQVMPLLTGQINENAVENMARLGRMAARVSDFLERQAAGAFLACGKQEQGRLSFPLKAWAELDPAVSSVLALRMMKETAGSRRNIGFVHVEQVMELTDKPAGKRLDLPCGLTAGTDGTILWIERKKTENAGEERNETEQNPVPPLKFRRFPYEKHMKIPENQYTKWFDYDKIKGTLSVRYRETGDYISLPGSGHKTVKSYMIDQKIPRELRGQIPLLTEGNHVLWVIGYRISEYYKITGETKSILEVTYAPERSDTGAQETFEKEYVRKNGGKEHG